jgi:aminoglycoside phosphotransferase (APT) family kinase protein
LVLGKKMLTLRASVASTAAARKIRIAIVPVIATLCLACSFTGTGRFSTPSGRPGSWKTGVIFHQAGGLLFFLAAARPCSKMPPRRVGGVMKRLALFMIALGNPSMESHVDLEACLPADLRGPATTVTRIAAGLSGAGVYRINAAGQVFVLKISDEGEPLAGWRRKVHIQQLAANAGMAPRVIHVDEARRAVVSAFVVDRSLPAFYGDPRTREAALVQLGRAVRRVHELPLPPEAESKDPRELLVAIWSGLAANFAVPAFVGDAVRRVLAEEAPARERPLVLSHNDVNPTNLVYDGVNLLLLDWETAGPNDPFYDLAAISVFLRMDEGTCQRLLAAYDGEPNARLPARFAYSRRLVAAMCGAAFLHLARSSGYASASGGETLDSTPSLGEFYQRMRSGSLSIATGQGQWWFGLALVKACVAL